MSEIERYGTRSLLYSEWHRTESTARYLGRDRSIQLGMIDLDDVEYCRRCSQPLMLIEIARDIGQAYKSTRVMRNLAVRADLPAALVLWSPNGDGTDIVGFRTRLVRPYGPEELLTPEQYAENLWDVHDAHECAPGK